MNPVFQNINFNNFANNDIDFISMINSPIRVKSHLHPLVYCFTKIRGKFIVSGNHPSWNCNMCNNEFSIDVPSFYCTFCDYDLCAKCFGNNKINDVKFYKHNPNQNMAIQNLNNAETYKWQIQLPCHIHGLVLIEKVNKNFMWSCNLCQTKCGSNLLFFYCSLCDFYLCQKCAKNQNGNNNNNINNNNKSISFLFKYKSKEISANIPYGTPFCDGIKYIALDNQLFLSDYDFYYNGFKISKFDKRKVEEIFNPNQINTVIVQGNYSNNQIFG